MRKSSSTWAKSIPLRDWHLRRVNAKFQERPFDDLTFQPFDSHRSASYGSNFGSSFVRNRANVGGFWISPTILYEFDLFQDENQKGQRQADEQEEKSAGKVGDFQWRLSGTSELVGGALVGPFGVTIREMIVVSILPQIKQPAGWDATGLFISFDRGHDGHQLHKSPCAVQFHLQKWTNDIPG